jgi:hypothetical protein
VRILPETAERRNALTRIKGEVHDENRTINPEVVTNES